MAIEYRIENNVLWISGKLDSSSAPELETAFAQLTENLTTKPPRAILEFSGVKALTSAPLRAMLTLAKRLRAANGDVVVVAPSAGALEALKVSGFLRMQLFKTAASFAEISKDAPAAEPPAVAAAATAPVTRSRLQSLPVGQPTSSPGRDSTASSSPTLLQRILKMLGFGKR
jgi:anti-anti-sigma factor